MKNCPWFSLRSNNLAFARFVGAIFGSCFREKSKSNSEFASLMSFFFSRFRNQTWKVRTHSGCSVKLMDRELVIRERDGQIFSVRHSLCLATHATRFHFWCSALSCCSCLSFICCSALIHRFWWPDSFYISFGIARLMLLLVLFPGMFFEFVIFPFTPFFFWYSCLPFSCLCKSHHVVLPRLFFQTVRVC